MNAHSVSIPSIRLHEIEAIAEQVRKEAEEGAHALGCEDPSVFDLAYVRAGPTEAVPNLTHDGRRQAGLLDCSGPVPRIYYEKYDPSVRQRFSVAHELGHFALHEGRIKVPAGCAPDNVDPPEYSLDEQGSDPAHSAYDFQPNEEAEADAFAAALLLPKAEVQQAVEKFGNASGFLAERFGVSLAAMRRRLMTVRALDG